MVSCKIALCQRGGDCDKCEYQASCIIYRSRVREEITRGRVAHKEAGRGKVHVSHS